MNILYLSDIDAGGEWIATQTLVQETKNEYPSLKLFLVGKSVNKQPSLLKAELFDHINIINPKKYLKPFKYYRQLLSEINQLSKAIHDVYKKNRIDKVIITYYPAGLAYLMATRKTDYIFYFHGVRNRFNLSWAHFNHFTFLIKICELLVWRLARLIILPSRVALKHLPNNKKIVVLPNLIRKEFFTEKNNMKITNWVKNNHLLDKKIIIYSGRIAEKKGVFRLIKTFKKCSDKNGNVHLVFCYMENRSEEEKAFINKYKNDERIFFIKNLPPDQLNALYRTSSLAILPSEFEIDPLFYFESIAVGLPIVATKVGTIKELKNPLLVNSNSEPEICKKITSYFKRELYYRRIFRQEALELGQNYHPNKIVDKFLWILKK